MSSSIGIAIIVVIGLMVAAVMRGRAVAKLKPVLEAAASKHKAKIHWSFLGMPQITKVWNGHAMRLTPMIISTSSPEGSGEMTSVDFDWPWTDVGEFRVREKIEARRNAIPVVLMGGNKPFTLGSPQLDRRYSAAGTNPVAALRIMGNARVAESLISLPGGADVHVRGGRCCVTVKGYPSGVEDVDRLFATSELLLEASMDVRREK
jgi:hypothetical protein